MIRSPKPIEAEAEMAIIKATDETFQKQVLESTKPVLVDLWAPWCQPCKAIEKELVEIEKQYGSKVTVVKVNIDENPAIVKNLEIRTVPTLLFYAGRNAAPISIAGPTTSKQIVSRFRLSELV
jgi:thioredoxin 1